MSNKIKYTPGEWTASEGTNTDAEGSVCLYAEGSVWLCADGENLFIVRGRTPGEARANAELVAAAPDMLEALWDAQALLQACGVQGRPMDRIADAIKKAEGNHA